MAGSPPGASATFQITDVAWNSTCSRARCSSLVLPARRWARSLAIAPGAASRTSAPPPTPSPRPGACSRCRASRSGPEDRGAHGVALAELGRGPLGGDPALDEEVGPRGQAERPLDVLLDE